MLGIIVFVKNSDKEPVKTRLAKTVGDAAAIHIYRQLVRHTAEVVSRIPSQVYVYYSSTVSERDSWPDDFKIRTQHGKDLGERMYHAMEETLQHCKKVVLIGSDCPQLHVGHIFKAFDLLDSCHTTFGPAMDGGYYLAGARKLKPKMFSDIEWSTKDTLKQTLESMKHSQLSYRLLPSVLSDIDNEEDLKAHGSNLTLF